MAERILKLTVALGPELVVERCDDRRASRDGDDPCRIGVGDIQMNRTARSTQAFRRLRAGVAVLGEVFVDEEAAGAQQEDGMH
jgi:hypothetical protein